MNQASEEKRKADRVPSHLYCRYFVYPRDGQGKWDITTTRNVSERVISIMTSRKLEHGLRVSLHIRIPYLKEMLEMTGVVLESTSKGISFITRIEFRDITPISKKLLREYMQGVAVEKIGPNIR
ncbi:MAG: PilZ domain-containing protein [Syntrophales bacterium]|nr:PilZ domain-containing protein [Syntrophales bacterium]